MKKIPLIFNRDENFRMTDECNNLCLWVFNGEGKVTRKYDGTSCMVKEGKLYKRREIKSGKIIPDDFINAGEDGFTKKIVGWVLVVKDDKWHNEAFSSHINDGTYELCGPKIQGNPEKFQMHTLVRHELAEHFIINDRTYEGIKKFFIGKDIEGVVFHHIDGRMAKIRKKDFGLCR